MLRPHVPAIHFHVANDSRYSPDIGATSHDLDDDEDDIEYDADDRHGGVRRE